MVAELSFRPARAADVDVAVPFIHCSGAGAFHFIWWAAGAGDGHAFVRQALIDGAGAFGWRHHRLGVIGDGVVAVGAGHAGATKWPFTQAAARQISSHRGARHAVGAITWGCG
jgi:hypothetical protein